VRLAHAERAADLPGRHSRQVPLPLLRRPVLLQQVGDDEVGVDDAGQAHPAAGELLDDERVGQQRLAQAAVLLRDHEAEDAHVGHAGDDVRRVLVLVLQFGRDGEHPLVDEGPHGVDDLALDVGETFGVLESSHDDEYQRRRSRSHRAAV
jgi:hypothetical protein